MDGLISYNTVNYLVFYKNMAHLMIYADIYTITGLEYWTAAPSRSESSALY